MTVNNVSVRNARGNATAKRTLLLQSARGIDVREGWLVSRTEYEACRYQARQTELALVLSAMFDCLARNEKWSSNSIIALYIEMYEIPVREIVRGIEEKEYTIKGFREALTRLTRGFNDYRPVY